MLLILLYQLLLLRNLILFWSDFLNEGSYLWMCHIIFIYVVNKMQWDVYVDSFSQSFGWQVGMYPRQPLICFFLSDILINEGKPTEKIYYGLCDVIFVLWLLFSSLIQSWWTKSSLLLHERVIKADTCLHPNLMTWDQSFTLCTKILSNDCVVCSICSVACKYSVKWSCCIIFFSLI